MINIFPSTDLVVRALFARIQSSRQLLDNTITKRGLPPTTSPSQLACRCLAAILPDYYTDSTNASAYTVLETKNWSSNCNLPAACFLTPVHSVQIAVALLIITLAQSKFAVRSGGHNPNPGFAGVGAEGVTIDMQGFTALHLSADKSYATVGAGLRFGAVQSYLDEQGVAVASGRNKDVGVSGLLLGGGHPLINSLTGLAADNIQSAEVVLLCYPWVVKASQTQNSHLFRALKGGLTNFGIVTSFELKTAMPRNIWYRVVAYSNSNPRAVFDALVNVQQRMEKDPKAGIEVTCSPAGFTVAFVSGQHTDDPEVFAPFRALTPTTETKPPTNGTTLEFISFLSAPQPEASRDTVGVTTYPDTDLYMDIYREYLAATTTGGSATTSFLLQIQTFGTASAQIAIRNGGNVMGTSARAQTWWNPIAQWTISADDAKVHKTLLGLADSIKAAAQAKGLYDKFIFANTASRDQNVLESYGPANLGSMLVVSAKYDVPGTFQKLQKWGFLASRA
ncbi:FAD-binding domain-containing protein [Lophium mytilinum]|uniref:FAD-binding domain-containing protein n=1 Tax=Lophium mytilinum TaxID=390894 RepID=A0A6A6R8G8_9PEZI|nr:FAD-binding domain-containing protein [Lophium mytilinum]